MDRDALEAHPKYEKIKELGQGRYIILFSMVILRQKAGNCMVCEGLS